MCISNLPTQFSEWKASSSLISDCFFLCVCVFFLSQLENSLARDCFFSVFWMQQSITSPYFLKLLPICTGERCHFSLNLRASLVLHIIGTSSAFVKKKRIGLCFTDGNMWPSKISNGPPKKSEGGQTWPSKLLTWGQHSYTEPSRKDVLPSKIPSLYKKMGPPISMMGPPSYSKLSPKDPQTFKVM